MPIALSFDQLVFGTMIMCGLFGLSAGLFRSLLDIAAILLGLLAGIAATASPDVVRLVMDLTGSSNVRYNKSVLMISVFIAVQLLVMLGGWVSTIGIDSKLTYGDRLLGAALGAGRGFVLFVVFFLVNAVAYQYGGMRYPPPVQSLSYPAVKATGQMILNVAAPLLPADIASAAARVRL